MQKILNVSKKIAYNTSLKDRELTPETYLEIDFEHDPKLSKILDSQKKMLKELKNIVNGLLSLGKKQKSTIVYMTDVVNALAKME